MNEKLFGANIVLKPTFIIMNMDFQALKGSAIHIICIILSLVWKLEMIINLEEIDGLYTKV